MAGRLRLGGAEEEALEHELKRARVLGRLGERRRQRLLEVLLVGPRHLLERRESVEQLRGAERHPLLAQLLGERQQLGVEAAGAAIRDPGVEPGRRLRHGLRRRTRVVARRSLELDADARRDRVEVGAVLDDHAHRLLEDLVVDVVGAEQDQRPGPVDRLGDAGRLLEVELADLVDDLDKLARDRLVEIWGVQADDLELVLESRGSRATGTGSGA